MTSSDWTGVLGLCCSFPESADQILWFVAESLGSLKQSYRLHAAVAGVHSLFVRLNEHFLSSFYVFLRVSYSNESNNPGNNHKNWKMALHKIQKHLYRKGTRRRRQHRMETFSSSAKDYQLEYPNSREKLSTKRINKSINKLAN